MKKLWEAVELAVIHELSNMSQICNNSSCIASSTATHYCTVEKQCTFCRKNLVLVSFLPTKCPGIHTPFHADAFLILWSTKQYLAFTFGNRLYFVISVVKCWPPYSPTVPCTLPATGFSAEMQKATGDKKCIGQVVSQLDIVENPDFVLSPAWVWRL